MRKKITHKNTQKILEIDGCDGCTTIWMYLISVNSTYRNEWDGKFYICFSTFFKIGGKTNITLTVMKVWMYSPYNGEQERTFAFTSSI